MALNDQKKRAGHNLGKIPIFSDKSEKVVDDISPLDPTCNVSRLQSH